MFSNNDISGLWFSLFATTFQSRRADRACGTLLEGVVVGVGGPSLPSLGMTSVLRDKQEV